MMMTEVQRLIRRLANGWTERSEGSPGLSCNNLLPPIG